MKLSIITINYNNLAGLRKTIESVEQQTVKDYEWVIIDGGSTDGSKELIEERAQSFNYWVSEPDKGIYNAMNKAIKVANGEYFLFLNSGESLADEEVVEKILPELTGEDYVFGNVNIVNEDGTIKSTTDYQTTLKGGKDFFYNSTTCHQGMVIKGEALKVRPYKEDLKIVADWEHLVHQLIINNGTFKVIRTVVSNFSYGGFSSIQTELMNRERRMTSEKYFSTFLLDEKLISANIARNDQQGFDCVSNFAINLAMEHRYSREEFMELFAPHKKIIINYGSPQVRIFNWLNINGWTLVANVLIKLRKAI